MKKVGIVGLGFVGDAIRQSYTLMNKLYKLETYDINESLNPTCFSLNELVNKCEMIYVCVPTPMNKKGKCDTSIVERVISDISKITSDKIIIIKSTVTPGTTERLQEKFRNNHILFCPEFLTEAKYVHDYMNQELMIIGVPDLNIDIFMKVRDEQIASIESVKTVYMMNPTAAELHKYIANTFLAMKVSFANEMANLTSTLNVDWKVLQSSISKDSRLGKSHWGVPGPDGHFGFGGTCFPKDVSAILHFAKELGVQMPVLEAVWNRNITIDRTEHDWEQLKGRAVTEE